MELLKHQITLKESIIYNYRGEDLNFLKSGLVNDRGLQLNKLENITVVIYGNVDTISKYWPGCSYKKCVIGFIGELDRNYIEGKKVLSFDEVSLMKPDLVIVVSELEELYTECIKLLECLRCDIPIYSRDGCDLRILLKKITTMKCDYYNCCIEGLKKQIRTHDIISFDIFDTLIMRKCYDEDDFFEILSNKVKREYGINNFKEIRKRGLTESKHNASIYDIYETIMGILKVSKTISDKLLDIEIQLEKSMLTQRSIMVDMLKFAVEYGKKVYLISDMYLPEDKLKYLLKENGIEDFEKIYVSCMVGKLKKEGLFQYFIEDLKIESPHVLHIGDNYIFDGFYAGTSQIDFFIVKDAKTILLDSNYYPVVKRAQNCNERSVLGLFKARLFNNPFCLYGRSGKPFVKSSYEFSYLFIGCLFLQFILWFIDEINKEKYDEILFGSRDGYFIKKLYEIVKRDLNEENLPKGLYFLISRQLGSIATIENEEDIKNILDAPYKYSPKWIMENKFNLLDKELLSYDQHDTMESYALKHKELIYEKSRTEKNNYCRYIEKFGLHPEKRYAFFDFVSRGSCQLYLRKLCNLNLTGVYFWHSTGRSTKDMLDLPIHADWESDNLGDSASYMFHFYLLLETFVTSMCGSLKKFDATGEPIYYDDMRTKSELKFIAEAQQGIIDFIDIYLQNLYIDGMAIGKSLADYLYSFTNPYNTSLDFEEIQNLMLVDDWLQERVPLDR